MKISIFVLSLALISVSGCSLLSTPLSTEQRISEIDIQKVLPVAGSDSRHVSDKPGLRVLSLNMAHGRKDSFSQFFVNEPDIRSNLADIVEFLKRVDADIVTLQEADSPSAWSGNFDHVEFLAREAGYAWYAHSNHVTNMFASYGTAVLSRFPLAKGYRVDFNPTPPTTRKGFTLAEVEWAAGSPDGEKLLIDVVSVHLDFSRRSKRINQIEDMKAVLSERNNPTIILGDFNSGWTEGDKELQALTREQRLKTHRPEANYLYTFFDKRLDWILVSEEFEFCNYYTAPDILSDHLAVISEIMPVVEGSLMADCGASIHAALAIGNN